MQPPRWANAGYSLLELLVVMAIMALIVVMAVPYSTGTVDRFSLASDARIVASGLRTLRDRARDMQKDVGVSATTTPEPALTTSEGQKIAVSSGTMVAIFAPGGGTTAIIGWDGSLSGTIVLSRAGKSARIYAAELNGPLQVEAVR